MSFKWFFLKPHICFLCLRSAWRHLHSTAALMASRLSPYCFVRTRGWAINLEFSACNVRIGTYDFAKSCMYGSDAPRSALKAVTSNLYWIRNSTGSQWRDIITEVIWSCFYVLVIIPAALFWILSSLDRELELNPYNNAFP